MDLRTALATIHKDPLWWRKIGIGGALMLTIIGYPLVAGMVMESLDNTRKGYPTPLPPWYNWSTRYLLGFLTLLIDFVFFLIPLFVVGLGFFCGALALVTSTADVRLNWVASVALVLLALFELVMFALSVAPVGRVLYAERGSLEDAMSMRTLSEVLRPGARSVYARARLRSLPVYLPAVLLFVASWLVVQGQFPGAGPAALVLLWLAFSTLLYAHLAVVQLYVAAERMVRYTVPGAFAERR